MPYQSEAKLEQELLKQLQLQHFTFVNLTDYDGMVDNFKEKFELLNKDKLEGKPLSEDEWKRIFLEIDNKSIYQSAKLFRDKFVIHRDDNSLVHLQLVDFSNSSKNTYEVSNQITVNGKYTNRYDVTLLINGLPFVQIELKRRGMDIKQAFNQIERYRKHSYTGLFRYIQMFVISNGVDTKYFANSDRDLLFSLTFFWTDENNVRKTKLSDFTEALLKPSTLLEMFDKYTVINDTDKVIMIMRPYQIYAAKALVDRAIHTTENSFCWAATGSGKTLTSFKTAQLLMRYPKITKIFFLVDRKDLDSQTIEEFNKFEAGSVDMTDKTDVLVKQIDDIGTKLICTTIQKMANAVKSSKYKRVMDKYKDQKVIFIVDECHRSQFGKMHTDIVKHFRKAQFLGFTGTPRFEKNKSQDGRTTADIFGKCVHTYLIKEAIHDENVLGFHVEYIKTFEGQYDDDDPAMVEAIDKDEVYDSDQRIELITNHIIANHKYKTVNRKYTAIFATSSIPALIKYYKCFKEANSDLKIAAVYSFGSNEDPGDSDKHSRDYLEDIIKDYNNVFHTNYSTDTFAQYNKDVSRRVKSAQIDILIVVNMYLTGFDSKPLNTLYVDKWLKYHDLLQAYSRTNRVEKSTKPFGNIVCYRNLKFRTDEALTMFSNTNNIDDILLKPYQYYVDQFNDAAAYIHKLTPTPDDVLNLMDEEDELKFIEAFKILQKTLLTLKTFVEFGFDNNGINMSEQEVEDYRSKYLYLYRKHQSDKQKASILDDIDFMIELMETNRINVAYIMNLIRNIDFTNPQNKQRDINHIITELDRTDNNRLQKKVELIKRFLSEVVEGLTDGSQVDEAYNKFEDEEKAKEINEFADKEDISKDQLNDMIGEYEYFGAINKKKIKDIIAEKTLKFIERRQITQRITEFIMDLVAKYE